MQQTLTHQTHPFHVHILVRIGILLIDVTEKMDFLIIHLLEEEEVVQLVFGWGNSSGKGNKSCTHCGFTNHTVDECYKKHGYPPGHKYHKHQGPSINNVNAVKEENENSNVE